MKRYCALQAISRLALAPKGILALVLGCFLAAFWPSKPFAAGCGANPRMCGGDLLCTIATKRLSNGNLGWHDHFKEHVAEARKRRLSCGVQSVYKNSILKSYFVKKLTDEERIKVQEFLKNKQLYSSPLDGLYGPSTDKALHAFTVSSLPNVDLNTPEGVASVFKEIIQQQASETNKDERAPDNIVVQEIQRSPTVDEVEEAFDNERYVEAREKAETLAIKGNPEAQYYLGLMYRDGLGALQLSKAAHMWFNIASMLGHKEAGNARDAMTSSIGHESVNEAQEMALRCVQSEFTDCGLGQKSSSETDQSQVREADVERQFRNLPLIKRKQLQYALKKTGLYSSSVDGVWGPGTSNALMKHLQNARYKNPDVTTAYEDLLSRVNVPSSFQSEKPKSSSTAGTKRKKPVTTRSSPIIIGRFKYSPIISNPSMSINQAIAVCEPQARLAGSQAGNSIPKGDYGATARCQLWGNYATCNQSANSGGVWGGLADGIASGLASIQAQRAVFASCLAKYGWKQERYRK